jgi:hypothetical protein
MVAPLILARGTQNKILCLSEWRGDRAGKGRLSAEAT